MGDHEKEGGVDMVGQVVSGNTPPGAERQQLPHQLTQPHLPKSQISQEVSTSPEHHDQTNQSLEPTVYYRDDEITIRSALPSDQQRLAEVFKEGIGGLWPDMLWGTLAHKSNYKLYAAFLALVVLRKSISQHSLTPSFLSEHFTKILTLAAATHFTYWTWKSVWPLYQFVHTGLKTDLLDIYRHYHQDTPDSAMFVATLNKQDNKICGMVAVDNRGPEHGAELRRMVVTADAQGKGVGKRLMRAYEDFIADHNYTRTFLGTSSVQFPAQRLYEGCGWKLVTVRSLMPGTKICGYRYEKPVDQIRKEVAARRGILNGNVEVSA